MTDASTEVTIFCPCGRHFSAEVSGMKSKTCANCSREFDITRKPDGLVIVKVTESGAFFSKPFKNFKVG